MLEGLNFIIMNVPDIEQGKQFYSEKLGFEVEADSPGFVQFKLAHPGAVFALQLAEPSNPYHGAELWWQVTDADATLAELAGRGVEVASPPADYPFGRAFSIKDTFGNQLNMYQLPAGR